MRAAFLSLAGWTLPGIVMLAATLAAIPLPSEVHAHMWRFAAAFMASWWIWAVITPVVRGVMRRVPLQRPLAKPLVMHALLSLVAALVFAAWFTLMLWLSRSPDLPPVSYADELQRFIGGHVLLGVAIYATVAAVITATREREARVRREIDTARLEGDLAQAQLRALQMQLQPHFLFNSLHAIAMLTDSDPAAAESMAIKLADLLRATLRLRDVPEVPLREELQLLRAYLEIEEARFSDRLVVTFSLPDDMLDVRVPSFILQPIVENAVRHGVAPTRSS
jgi:two-component system LytT family sensor kinase